MDKTISERKRLGFPTKAQFLREHAIYTRKSLDIAGHEIMQRWETNYMKKLASIVCNNGGSVLELGFGMGISAHFIEKYRQSKPKLRNHVIIEAHPEVCRFAERMFAREIKTGKIELMHGYWQDLTKNMKSQIFDGILFDTYPLSDEEIHKNHYQFFCEARRLLRRNGIFTYYSDEAREFSEEHIKRLKEAGFSRIEWEVCKVNPQKGNMYWRKGTILAPKIMK